MTSTNGSEETNQTIGDKETNRLFGAENWRSATNKVIAKNLLDSIETLLEADVRQCIVTDRKTMHQRIIIDYDYQDK